MNRSSAIALSVALFALLGCKRPAPVTASPPSAQWIAGELPAEPPNLPAKDGGVFRIRIPTEPASLNRISDRGQDGWVTRITVGPIYETLLTLDRDSAPEYRLRPLLAEAWEVSADRKTTTFHLRQGVTFHDGQAFSAADVKAVMDAIMDPRQPTTTLRSLFSELERYEAPDARTFVLHWKRPDYLGTRNFATSVPIVPAAALANGVDQAPLQRAPVGTGPFRFEAWTRGESITLRRNDAYWGPKAHLGQVIFKVVPDANVAVELAARGELELLSGVSPETWRSLERPDPANAWAQQRFNRVRFAENNYFWIGWNEAVPALADARVRRALGHLYPAAQIAQSLDLGLEPPTTCPFYAQGPSCDPSITPLAYDPAKAAALLDEAGFPRGEDGLRRRDGAPLRLTFLTNAHSAKLSRLAPLLQEEYRKAGVTLEIESVEWATFIQRLRRHQFDVTAMLWSEPDVEQDLFQIFHSSQIDGGSNFVGYKNPKVDALIEESHGTFDPARRHAIDRSLHRLLFDDQVYDFLSTRPALDLVTRRAHGVRPALNWYDLSRIWLEDAAR